MTARLDRRHLVTTGLTAFAVLTLSLLVVGVLARLLVFDSAVGDAEHDLTRWIADHRIAPLDTLASVGSALSDTWTVIGTAVGATAMLAAARYRSHALVLPIALTLELSVFLSVSTIIGRDRPDVTPLGSVPSTSSFPSGHVAAALVLYGGLALIAVSVTRSSTAGRVAAVPATFAVLFVAAARVYEGLHHPSDVLGGALLGVGALLAAGLIAGVVEPVRWRPTIRSSVAERPRMGVTPK
jgi:membrane-associated phospholipid phosphatase